MDKYFCRLRQLLQEKLYALRNRINSPKKKPKLSYDIYLGFYLWMILVIYRSLINRWRYNEHDLISPHKTRQIPNNPRF